MTPITAEEAAQRAAAAARDAAHGRGRTDDDVDAMIERFGRHADGYFHARVVVGGRRFYLHRRFGSWLAPGQIDGRPVLKEPEGLLGSILGREVKFALSARTRPIELAERRRREEEEHARQQAAKPPGHAREAGESGRPAEVPGAGDSGRPPEPVSPDGSEGA